MRFAKAAVATFGLIGLAGCNSNVNSSVGGGYQMLVDEAALTRSYLNLKNFDLYETAASNIRNSAVFQFQKFVSSHFGLQHFSLSAANVEYAHAVGLTGNGQTIAVIDEGFLASHEQFSGKSISSTGTIYAPSGSDPCISNTNVTCHGAHGTAVAAIAAGSGLSGTMTGVAPDADLHLSLFYNYNDMANATNAAAAMGAIVQNNSWGFPNTYGSQSNFNNLLSASGGQSYVNALRDFAQNGVVVFAASNDSRDSSYDLAVAFPDFIPGLEASFIAAINVTPTIDASGNITAGTRVSAACLEAARYCLAADGTIRSASVSASSPYAGDNYAEWTGTSFAAPQVSGAIALLAEAFPTLTPQELRARLLASADNSFFSHDGYVDFSENVRHGYSVEFGHGFMDVAAALLPIGGSYMPVSSGGAPIPISNPTVLSTGPAGNAISAGLLSHDIVFGDDLGGGFKTSAAILSAHAVPTGNPSAFLDAQLAGPAYEVAALDTGFASYMSGEELSTSFGNDSVSVLVPHGGQGGTVGVDYKSRMNEGLEVGLTAIYEGHGVAGVNLGNNLNGLSSVHGAASLDFVSPISASADFAIGARVGVAVPLGNQSGPVSIGSARYDELAMRLTSRNVGAQGDHLSFGVVMPQAISGGDAQFELPVALSASGETRFDNVGISMAPEARQIDLNLDYARPIAANSDLLLSATYSLNYGHVEGHRDSSAAIGWRFKF